MEHWPPQMPSILVFIDSFLARLRQVLMARLTIGVNFLPANARSNPKRLMCSWAGALAVGISALAPSGLLADGVGANLAIAAPLPIQMPSQGFNLADVRLGDPATVLPAAMVNTLRQDLSKKTGIPAKKLRVVEASARTWNDGCLGLGKPNELCTQALVPGWRVVMTNGTQRWIYRTDQTGRIYRLESPAANPNAPIKKSVLPTPPRPTSSQPGGLVAESGLTPRLIPTAELPAPLSDEVVFRAVSSGGFTGRTTQMTLLSDGRLVRESLRLDGTASTPEIRQLPVAQVRQFRRSLKQHKFQQFHRQAYPATPGSADFITVTLVSHNGAVRYADSIQAQLPEALQAIIANWGQLTQP
jgi:hypothetical protein